MMVQLVLCMFAAICINNAFARPMEATYRIKNSVVIENNDAVLTKLVIMMPLAQTNQYQTVTDVSENGGVVVNIPQTDDKYLRWTITRDLPSRGKSREIYYNFNVTPHAIVFDFSRITALHPYDTSSDVWKRYTGASGAYVDPDNATVRHIGDSIGSRSSDIVDYARRCYLFVAAHYSYLNPNTGIHPLQNILDAGGGDCGNLTSIYVSLLRYRKIPSRHIVTVRPDGSYHVWADFFLERYGWIPVDVTVKKSNPSGDFFGKYDGNGIIMTKGVGLLMDRGDGYTYTTDLLQNFHWWYWCSTDANSVSASHRISSVTTVACRADFLSIDASNNGPGNDRNSVPNGLSVCKMQPAPAIGWYNLKGQKEARWSLHRDIAPVNAVGIFRNPLAAEELYGGDRFLRRVMLR